jgi:hypothetical protein
MAEKKSIYEEALLDVKIIQEALNANTKEILRSVAREEIDGLVKESLEEADYEEEAVGPEGSEEETETDDETTDDTTDVVADAGDETDDDSTEDSIEIDGDETDDADDTEMGAPEVGPDDQEIGMGADDALGGDELDMTDASDDDVIAIYKKLSGDDEVEIVGDEIHLNISEPGEYIVKKGALGMGDSDDMGDMENMDDMEEEYQEEGYEEEGLTYEIAMGDDKPELEESDESEEVVAEVEETDENEEPVQEKIKSGVGMSVGGHSNLPDIYTKGPGVKKESVSSKAVISETEIKYKKLLNESAQLKNENEEFRKALKKFRNMLVETVVFNSNLSYVTKLFMEHSTTKDEKKKIIQRFDEEVTNLKESKRLYKTIVNDLTARKPMNESVEKKIMKEVTTSSSKQLNEATAYVDPSTLRIKDLIARVENKDKY